MQSILQLLPAFIFFLFLLPHVRVSCHGLPFFCFSFIPLLLFVGSAVIIRKKLLNYISVLSSIALLVLIAQLGVIQFIIQSDVNLYLLGEPSLSVDGVGIAKFTVVEEKLIRSYGLLSHANIFGGMMLIATILCFTLPKGLARTSLVSITIFALVVSFSRNAIVGLLFFVMFESWSNRVSPKKILYMLALILLIGSPLLVGRLSDPQDVAGSERLRGYGWASQILKEQSIWIGSGRGTYIESVKRYVDTNGIQHNSWEIAPVHSVPLLLAVELGLLPTLGILIVLLYFIVSTRFWYIVFFAPALVFDHYFITDVAALFLIIMLYTFWNGGGIQKTSRRST